MHPLRQALVSTVLVLGSLGSAQALDFHADLYLGAYQGSDDTEPVDQRTELGLMADLTLDVLPFGFCANVYYNEDDVSNASTGLEEMSALEVQIGLYKQFDVPVVHPFIGGGVTWLNTTLDSVGVEENEEATIGAWAYVGARMTILLIDFGVAVGYTYAEVEVEGEDVDVGGWRAGVFAGIGF